MNIAENAAVWAKGGGRVLAGNVEEGAVAAPAVFAGASGLAQNAHRLRCGATIETKLRAALEQLAHAPIFIDDTPGIALSEMRAKARRLKQQQGRAGPDYRRLSATDVGLEQQAL